MEEQSRTGIDQSFRDYIGTIDEKGKRRWIFPKKPAGKFTNYRTYVSWLLLFLLFLGPHLKINGEPMFLFNVLERKFIIFGNIFWPQDFHLFVLAMLTLIVFIVLFTVVFGRLFCGWICPQTIFMEMVFRKIEYWIEGDYKHQQKLNKQTWDAEKIRKKTLKHFIFFLISFAIANTFLAYMIGADALWKLQTDPVMDHLGTLTSLLIFTAVFYFVFSWFREQVCIVACPYGRLQGVMLDRNSIVVAYDYLRGEARAKFRKNEDRETAGKGDCIDCNQCVDVCPTGIDIRNGTQLECVNCTACIDACDHMMENVGLPKGLIRYDSEEGIVSRKKRRFTTRSIAYSIVLVILLGVMGFLLTGRSEVETILLRTPGMIYQKRGEDKISNLYNIKVVNKSREELNIHFELLNNKGNIEMVGKPSILVPKNEVAEGALFIIMDRDELEAMKTKVRIGVFSGERKLEEISTNFVGPAK